MRTVIINCFDTYEHRVDLLYKNLKQMGHSVTVLASNFRHIEKNKRVDTKEDFVFLDALPYKKNLSYQRLNSHIKFSKTVFSYLDTMEAIDLIWVLIPPNSFVKDAVQYKKTHKTVKLVFDLIDLWPESMPIGFIKNFFPFTMWQNIRDKYLDRADFIVTECDLYQEKLKENLNGKKVSSLYLAKPIVPYEPELNLPYDRFSLCYLGSINNIIDIDLIGEIIYSFRKIKPVEFHIIGDGESKEKLINISGNAGAKVFFHGKIYDKKAKQKIFDSCHYGLNIMKPTVCVGLTMKSMDYFEAGLPLINNIHGDTWNIITKYNSGINWIKNCEIKEYKNDLRLNARKFYEDSLTEVAFTKKLNYILQKV